MKPALTVLRSRIRVGSSETLSAQTCQCPRCDRTVCLMWPEYVLHVPLHRVIWLDCPGCAISFSVLAMDLVPVSDAESLFLHAVVNHLS
jgi:hypothetical protein